MGRSLNRDKSGTDELILHIGLEVSSSIYMSSGLLIHMCVCESRLSR